MAKREDYTPERLKDAHELLDFMFERGMPLLVAGKQPHGGMLHAQFGNRNTTTALLNKLARMANEGKLW